MAYESEPRRTVEIHEERNGAGAVVFIVGGLVVAVGVLFWLAFGDTAPAAGDGDLNLSIDSSTIDAPAIEAPAADAAPEAAAPEAAAPEAAPAGN